MMKVNFIIGSACLVAVGISALLLVRDPTAVQSQAGIEVKSNPDNHFSGVSDPNAEQADEKALAEMVVRTYFESAKKEDFKLIKGLVAQTPPYYWEYRKKEAESRQRNDYAEVSRSISSSEATASDNYELVTKQYYAEVTERKVYAFRGLLAPIKHIEGVFVKEGNARVRVLFDTVQGLPSPTTFDFFLVKRDGNWKIFRISWADEKDNYPI